MKLLLVIALLISGNTFAQTNVIAAKSHAAKSTINSENSDNFGLPSPIRVIDRVEYLHDDCLVETRTVTRVDSRVVIDTICDHPFLKEGTTDVARIKAMYPKGTKFRGFGKLKKSSKKKMRQLKKGDSTKKSNGMVFLLFGTGLFLLYLFIPKMTQTPS